MQKKRGQVTAFIVIGLLIVLMLGIFFYFQHIRELEEIEKQSEQVQHFSTSVLKVAPYITDCIESEATIAIILTAEHGGYIEEGNITLPPIDLIEESISTYVNDHIGLCTNFDVFKEFNITEGEIRSEAHVYLNNVIVEVDWPIYIQQKGLTVYEKDFRVVFPLKLHEMYEKVEKIVEHNKTLDMEFMLQQELDIEIAGCEQGSIKYLVNDKDYVVNKNALAFFFRTELQNISKLFEFENGIKYLVPVPQGKNELNLIGKNKKISLITTDDGFINGCYSRTEEISHYTYSIVEENEVPISVSLASPSKISITKESINGTNDLSLSHIFRIDSNNVLSGILTMKKSDVDVIQNIYFYENGQWQEIETYEIEDYLIADINRKGIYATGVSLCPEIKAGSHFSVAFIPVNYENKSEFIDHAKFYSNLLLNVTPVNEFADKIAINVIMKENNLDCSSWNSWNCSENRIMSETNVCKQQPDYIVALINQQEIGLDHKTEGKVSYIGSALTYDDRFCTECNFVVEFGHFMGLGDEYVSNRTIATVPPNCADDFSGNESIPCLKWQNVAGTGCYQGCIYENWYRSTKGFILDGEPTDEIILVNQSIMRGSYIDGQNLKIDNIYFGPVSEKYLREQFGQ